MSEVTAGALARSLKDSANRALQVQQATKKLAEQIARERAAKQTPPPAP